MIHIQATLGSLEAVEPQEWPGPQAQQAAAACQGPQVTTSCDVMYNIL